MEYKKNFKSYTYYKIHQNARSNDVGGHTLPIKHSMSSGPQIIIKQGYPFDILSNRSLPCCVWKTSSAKAFGLCALMFLTQTTLCFCRRGKSVFFIIIPPVYFNQ